MKRLTFFALHRGLLAHLILAMIPTCLTDFWPRFTMNWGQNIRQGCAWTPQGVKDSKSLHCTVIMQDIFTQTLKSHKQLIWRRLFFPISKKTGCEREKCCTQRFRKCLFARSCTPGKKRIWDWIFSKNIIQALFIVTVTQSRDHKSNFHQSGPVEYCEFLYLLSAQKVEIYLLEVYSYVQGILFFYVPVFVSKSDGKEENNVQVE